ncbi:rod shape-determining protein MreD [Paenibacillus chartarius]|uniref:Rod shape-determining protein MreD n=1 Tax=Paenibacillus chartarius TaxID=747481 RepID=A0ABV6DIX6_9BACL
MRRHYIWMLLFVLLLLQGTVMVWLMPASWQSVTFVVPHFTLTVVIFVGLYIGRHPALIYGIIFGLLQDFLFYGTMLGVYSFGMGLTGYLAGLLQRRVPGSLMYRLISVGLGQFLFNVINYGLNRLFNVTKAPFEHMLTSQMLPSLLFNVAFALLIYVPLRRLLEKVGEGGKSEQDE